jgi:site-specific recombinase XerD
MFNLSYWRKLEDDFLNFLSEKGYTPEAIKHYRCVTNRLVRFANASNDEAYTPEVGIDFLESEERLEYLKDTSYRYQRMTIRRLEEYLDGEKYSPVYLRVNYECPGSFKDVYDKYLMVLENSGMKYNTLKQHRVFYAKLFQDFVNNGVESWDAVKATTLTDAFSRCANKGQFATYAKKLFKYLVKEHIVKYNYSRILPKIQYWQRIPSVYSDGEITAILNSVNRTTEAGKRDYAILLLAARLGMCAADIRLLRFKDVNFENKTIDFARHKTGVPQRLTLLPEIETALRDYIDNARGDMAEPYIFLTSRKSVQVPLSRGVVSSVAAKYFRESGIKFGDRRHGSHALRSSLASALVAENVPYDAVRTILGHEDPNTITHYVKLDVENLRSCALNVPIPSGRFAEYLINGKGAH